MATVIAICQTAPAVEDTVNDSIPLGRIAPFLAGFPPVLHLTDRKHLQSKLTGRHIEDSISIVVMYVDNRTDCLL